MKKIIQLSILVGLLVISICGCGKAEMSSGEQSKESIIATEEATSESTVPTAHEHEYVKDTIVQPTCTAEGYTVYKCECGDTYDSEHTKMLEHAFKETVIAPTTEIEGYTLYTCTICNHSEKDNFTILYER